jgi:DNA-binding PadR family transcriptional regulator
MPTDPQRFLPLRPVDLELLLALAAQERHGYALVQEIADHTGGLINLDPGNFYRVIKRMLADGLLAESEQRSVPEVANARRRYYRLTAEGRRVLAAELERLHSLVTSRSVRALARRLAT